MGDVYVNGEPVGTHDIPLVAPAPALVIPTELWYTIGGIGALLVVGILIWVATRRRGTPIR